MGEKPRQTVRFDEDLYDKVCEEENRTGNTKSKIVNKRIRRGYEKRNATLEDTILPVFGQGLFVAGFVVALISLFWAGIGLGLSGLGIIIGVKVDAYMDRYHVNALTALVRVLGA